MKLTRIVEKPMGQGMDFAPQQKQWIATAIATAVGLASSLIGASQASKARRASAERQWASEADEKAWYLRRYNQDYTDTAAGQNLLRRAKDYAKENWRKAAGAQAVGGGTDAATALAKESGNKMVADTISNIAAQDSENKARVDDSHRHAQQQFAQMDMQREMQRAQDITTASQNASNAIMQGAAAFEQGSSAKTPSLQGGNNKGTPVNNKVSVPVGTLGSDGNPLYEDADKLKRLMQSAS